MDNITFNLSGKRFLAVATMLFCMALIKAGNSDNPQESEKNITSSPARQGKIVEVLELEPARKWELLTEYYKAASTFYDVSNSVVTDEEIETHIRKLKKKPSPKIRKEILLKDWAFRSDPKREGVKLGFFSQEENDKGWKNVSLPHTFNYEPANPQRFGRLSPRGAFTSRNDEYCDIWRADYDIWYKQKIKIDAGKNKNIQLSVNSANLLTDIWVNEDPVMLQHLGLFPFTTDIAYAVDAEIPETTIAMKITNIASTVPELFYNGIQYSYNNKPYTNGRTEMDWINQAWAGLAGDVTLKITDKTYISDAFLSTAEIVDKSAIVSSRVTVKNDRLERFKGKILIEISKWLPAEGPVIKRVEAPFEVLPGKESLSEIKITLDQPDLWDFDQPNMYLAYLVVIDDKGNRIDDKYETFGVRTIKTIGNKFYVNNKKVILRGTHNTTNYSGESLIAPGDKIIVKDILMHKRMGSNCSRWPSDNRCSYARIADYCDQMGFMVSWAGFLEMFIVHPEDLLYARRDMTNMVRLLKNHPSILMWEMGDEVPEDINWYEQVYSFVENEDDTRPIIPSGAWSNFTVNRIVANRDSSLTFEQKRQAVLKDYPVFESPLAVWDYHFVPCLPGRGKQHPVSPMGQGVDLVKNTLGGHRATVFTEFGVDALPDYKLVIDIYGKFRWATNPLMLPVRKDYDIHNYGREIKQEDWRETQAYQAIVLENIIRRLREYPDEFAGYYFLMMYDIWTWYWGVADYAGNPKLAYFVVRSCYQPVYISGLQGDAVIKKSDKIEVTVSNYGNSVADALLKVTIKNKAGSVVEERNIPIPEIDGNVSITTVPALTIGDLTPGLYRIEYYLNDKSGNLMGKTLEFAFVE